MSLRSAPRGEPDRGEMVSRLRKYKADCCRLNSTDDPNEQLTFSTHLVHPAIISIGERWSRNGALRKMVVQGEASSSPLSGVNS